MIPAQLENKVHAIAGKDLSTLADDQIFAILAYELWKDGMDWDQGVSDLAEGKPNLQYKTREDCINFLKTVFGY